MSGRKFSRTEWIFCLLLVLVTVAVYGGVFSSDFIRFDDPRYIAQNRHVRAGLTLDGAAWAFTTFFKSNWHPLAWLSHQLDVELFGLRPGPHHLVSLLLHTASAVVAFRVFLLLGGAAWPALLAAALFAVHPLRAESVAWAAERKDTLSGVFWMLTLLAYALYAARSGSVAQERPRRVFTPFTAVGSRRW